MEDRKARIAALRAKAGRAKLPPPTDSELANKDAPVLQVVALTHNNNAMPPPAKKKQKGKQEEKKELSVLEKVLRQAQAEAKSSASITPGGAMEDVAPKKINADLKREIQPKLDKLERRTQKAIVALLRERLEQEAAAADIDD